MGLVQKKVEVYEGYIQCDKCRHHLATGISTEGNFSGLIEAARNASWFVRIQDKAVTGALCLTCRTEILSDWLDKQVPLLRVEFNINSLNPEQQLLHKAAEAFMLGTDYGCIARYLDYVSIREKDNGFDTVKLYGIAGHEIMKYAQEHKELFE